MDKSNNLNPFLSIPGAIIIAGVAIAVAIFLTRGSLIVEKTDVEDTIAQAQQSLSLDRMRPVSEEDHILGNPNAPVKIVVYSDLECPFCKYYHINTLKKVADEYSKTGKVALVYRHFPLDSIHPKARKEAVATECAAELGGNDAFWKYLDRIYEITPSNNGLDPDKLPEIAGEVGLNVVVFSECLESKKFDKKISDDLQNAINTGGSGTPWSIMIDPSVKLSSVNGMVDYATMKSNIDTLLENEGDTS